MNRVEKLLRHLMMRDDDTGGATEFEKQLNSLGADAKPDPKLIGIIHEAWASGQTIDLSGVGYGPAHWDGGEQFLVSPEPYYFFLAGLVRSQSCTRVFEIGTHYGGSALSMLRAATSDQGDAHIVTVDVTDLNRTLHSIPNITKITGDANSEIVLKQALIAIGKEPIDLLYIDASHRFLPAITNLGLYFLLLRPRFVVLDDILLNPGMRSLWSVICATYGSRAINCVDVIPKIRAPDCGFGLLMFR